MAQKTLVTWSLPTRQVPEAFAANGRPALGLFGRMSPAGLHGAESHQVAAGVLPEAQHSSASQVESKAGCRAESRRAG